ncbi:MAG: protein kinase [Acidobacteria bacterium]|nr:protein kinase [Acidobacteriota bacterium]
MAPEQLEGRDADARADLFAFGAVLYEMITGKRAFEGRSHVALISAVMSAEPPRVTAAQPLAPPMLDDAVSRCLEEDPDERWQSAQDLSAELRGISGMTQPEAGSAVPPREDRRTVRLPRWALAALLVLPSAALAGWATYGAWRADASAPAYVAIPLGPAEGLDGRFALSADGRRLAFVGQREGRSHLFVRSLDRAEATLLTSSYVGSAAPPFRQTAGGWRSPAGAASGRWRSPGGSRP